MAAYIVNPAGSVHTVDDGTEPASLGTGYRAATKAEIVAYRRDYETPPVVVAVVVAPPAEDPTDTDLDYQDLGE